MKHKLLSVVLLLSLGAVAADDADTTKEADQALSALNEAFATGKPEAIQRLMTEDHVAITPYYRGPVTRSEQIKSLADLKLSEYRTGTMKKTLLSSDVALFTYPLTQTGTFKEAPLARHNQVVAVWVRRDGRWLEASYQETAVPSRWEKSIQEFEAEDRQHAPQSGGVLFLGSSSIRLWDLKSSFPDVRAVNRGFGGSQIADSVEFADRIILPHRPRLIVFYAGDNDIAGGKSAEQVAADFQALVGKVHANLPETRIAFIAVKPCPSRWKHIETQKQANRLVEEFTKTDARLAYVDVVKPMLNAEGKPREDLFRKDNLHLNDEGYKLWNEIVKPLLAQK
jgi:lysophospholipase L1-like esterase/ketosteroid isomerase-like protein